MICGGLQKSSKSSKAVSLRLVSGGRRIQGTEGDEMERYRRRAVKSAAVLLSAEVLDELRRQAMFFGYQPGSVSVYLADRLTQIADPLLMQKLPPPVRSWPPSPPRKRPFLLEDDKAA